MSVQKKPPVVTIMGHVDHGKTSLLDYIRRTKLAEKEYGQITQAIGAYQIEVNGKKITFIDTPGHQAFAAMRARGAKAADLVVLVVSGVDGVMPQTIESIKLILENKVPFLVALTKSDLPEFSADRVKAQLLENEVFVEGYGGNTVIIPVSSKTGAGIDQLLEMILLMTDMEELKADSSAKLQAVVVESKADKFCGCLATIIIQNGTLRVGDKICDGENYAKVKLMRDSKGQPVAEALPGQPVVVLGFSKLPKVGGLIKTIDRDFIQNSSGKDEVKSDVSTDPDERKQRIIIKADTFGSLEAILGCLPKEISVVNSSIGEIKESDIYSAKILNADIYGFNLNIPASVEKLSHAEKVKIKTFKVIYDLLLAVDVKIKQAVDPKLARRVLGKAEVLTSFDMKGQKIAGAKVVEGKISRKYPVFLTRNQEEIGEARIISLKQQKLDVNEVEAGQEFGLVLDKKFDFFLGDVITSFNLEE